MTDEARYHQTMKAFLLIDIAINDRDGFMEYVGQIGELIATYGGEYVVRGEVPTVVLPKETLPERVVVIEFPSRDNAERFLKEREEKGLAALFARATTSRILLTDGVQE